MALAGDVAIIKERHFLVILGNLYQLLLSPLFLLAGSSAAALPLVQHRHLVQTGT